MNLVVHQDGSAVWRGARLRCAVGRAGIRRDKREGDGATPAGIFALRRVLYRPDRLARPRTILPVTPIDPADGWCDAPEDAAYNRQVRLPHASSAERLWRDDRLYDLVAVTSHNSEPPVAGLGSAIFVHLARPDFAPTEGCVAFALADLRRVLAGWRPDDRLEAVAATDPVPDHRR
jgi:L,D-peptidoglycan transpeptidase YkuD (ErfK/YbiS/YcfS/YnhG family)